MGWKINFSFLNTRHEIDILDKYGMCCQVPALFAVYSINEDDVIHYEGKFIRYECICGKWLYVNSKSANTVGEWI